MVLIPNLRSSCTSAVFHTHESRLKAIFCTSMILDEPKRPWFIEGTLIGLSVPFEFYFANIVQMTMISQSSILPTPRQITFAWRETSSYVFSYFPSLCFSISDAYILHCARQTPDDVPDDWKVAAAAMKSKESGRDWLWIVNTLRFTFCIGVSYACMVCISTLCSSLSQVDVDLTSTASSKGLCFLSRAHGCVHGISRMSDHIHNLIIVFSQASRNAWTATPTRRSMFSFLCLLCFCVSACASTHVLQL